MKKTFSKKLMILAFAFGGLFMIGNNVFATDTGDGDDTGDGTIDDGTRQSMSYCTIWKIDFSCGNTSAYACKYDC